MIAWLLATSAATADTWPPGTNLIDAAAIQISDDGFASMSTVLPQAVPSDPVVLDPVVQEEMLYSVSLSNAWVGVETTALELIPQDGVLDIRFDLLVNINDPDVDPTLGLPPKFNLDYTALFISDECLGWIEPFPVGATLPFSLDVVTGPDGKPVLDATMGAFTLENGLGTEHIQLECGTGSLITIDQVIKEISGYSLVDYLIESMEESLYDQIAALQADLEAQLEDALNQAYLDQTVDVNGIPLHVELYPQEVEITEDGMDLRLQGLSSAPPAACTDLFDPDEAGSIKTSGDLPDIGDFPSDSHAGLVLSDDYPNQLLYALWRGGLLCYDLSAGQVDIGFDLDTSLLGLLGGEPFQALFPEAQPMIVRTEPRQSPVVEYDGNHDLIVQAHDVGLEFYTELDYRNVHALGVALDVDAGVDFAFDDQTGLAAVEVALGEDEIGVRIGSNELAPGSDEAIVVAFQGLMDSIITPMIGDALTGLSFGVPSYEGLGLVDFQVDAMGDGTWLGGLAVLGPVTYTGDCSQGCSGGGCNGGPVAPVLAVGLAALVARRRRPVS